MAVAYRAAEDHFVLSFVKKYPLLPTFGYICGKRRTPPNPKDDCIFLQPMATTAWTACMYIVKVGLHRTASLLGPLSKFLLLVRRFLAAAACNPRSLFLALPAIVH